MRGGILDVFPPTEEHPLRLEFWGDTVEEIRWFKVADQRSPRGRRARPVGAAVPRAAAHRRRARRGPRRSPTGCPAPPTCSRSSPRASPSRAWSRWRRPSSTAWRPLLDLLPDGAVLVACDPERVRTRAHDLIGHEPGVPRRRLGQRRERQRRADRPRSGARHGVLPHPGRAAPAGPRPSACAGSTSPRSPATTTGDTLDLGARGRARPSAATPTRPSPSCAGSSPTTGRCWSPPRAPAWPSASPRCSPSTTPPSRLVADDADPEPGLITVTTGAVGAGFLAPGVAAGRHHRDRPHRVGRRLGHVHQGHAADAVAAPQPGRPAPAAARRLRRARAARRRPVRRDDAAHRRRRHPRVPRARVRRRASAATPATGSTCPPTSSTRSPATSAASSPP